MNTETSENNKKYKVKELMNDIEFETYQYSVYLSQLAQAKKQKLNELNITNQGNSSKVNKKYMRLILNEDNLFDLLPK